MAGRGRNAAKNPAAGGQKRRSARLTNQTEAKDDPAEPIRPAKKKKTSDKKEKKQQKVQIHSFTDKDLEALLKSLPAGDVNKELRQPYLERICEEMAKSALRYDTGEINRLSKWLARFQGELAEAEVAMLGSRIATLGYGSLAGKDEETQNIIDNVITSCGEDDEHRKGRMLSHFLYRSFLKHIHNSNGFGIAGSEATKKKFLNNCSLIWQDTGTGIVMVKRDDGNTHEPCATSLLAAYIGSAIHDLTKGSEGMAVWTNEFPLIGSGAPKEAGKKKRGRNSKHEEEGPKQPRCDGLLVMPDPRKNKSLRALVIMQAKMASFTTVDDYQSKSNAVDAFSRQPKGEAAWPLLVFRTVINKVATSVEVLALVPTSEKKAMLVPMWKSNDSDSLYNAVMASVLAAKDFREELERKQKQLVFCRTGQNVAIDDDEKMVYKSFVSTERRNVNLHLIKRHVDSDATETKLGSKGSYVQMKYAGSALRAKVEGGTFLKVANSLALAHLDDTCHGDVRLDNMVLATGILIDWDLAGKENEASYPKGMQVIVDGERHPDVKAAIERGTISELKLSKLHDWYSLKAAMKLFKPTDESKTQAWINLIDNIDQSDQRARAQHPFYLTLRESDLKNRGLPTRATGSPK